MYVLLAPNSFPGNRRGAARNLEKLVWSQQYIGCGCVAKLFSEGFFLGKKKKNEKSTKTTYSMLKMALGDGGLAKNIEKPSVF